MAPTRVSVSLGANAVPAVKEALAHAAEHPDHDPVVWFTAVPGQRVWWRCFGAGPRTEDPFRFCAQGGDVPGMTDG